MPEPLIVDAIGVLIELDLTGLSDADDAAVRAAWRDAAPSNAISRATRTSIRVREPGDESDITRLLERLSQRVTLAAITERRGELWMLHAAGLALPDGRVIALIGPSGRGKTTAARALARELDHVSIGYVTDECVAVDAGGSVRPYRKPLSVIEDGRRPKRERAASNLGLGALPNEALRLAAIILLDRDPDAPDEPVVTPVDLGDALEELVSQTSFLSSLRAPLVQIAEHVAAVGGLQRVTYREAATLAGVLPALAAPLDGPRSVFAATPSARRAQTTAGIDDGVEAWFRADSIDAIDLDDPQRIALLRADAGEGTLHVIAGIAPALWRHAAGASRDELVASAVAEHGEPEGHDSGVLVDAALAELASEGVLEFRVPRWRIRDDVAVTGGPGRYVVLPLSDPSATPLIVEGSAALIWEALQQGGSHRSLVSTVADLALVEPEAVRDDLRAFLLTLVKTRIATAT